MRKVLLVTLLSVALATGVVARAQSMKPGRIEDPGSIRRTLEGMPFNDKTMGYRSLAERLERLGLSVKRIDVDVLTAVDEKDDPTHVKRGDLSFTFLTAPMPAPVRAICPLSELFHVVKRGSRWIPQDRTANWLLNGPSHCQAPV